MSNISILKHFSDEEISILNSIALFGSLEDIQKKLDWGIATIENEFGNILYQNIKNTLSYFSDASFNELQSLLPQKTIFSSATQEEDFFVNIFSND